MTNTCVLCGEAVMGEPAYQAPNGPVCKECEAKERKLATKMRKKRKRRKHV